MKTAALCLAILPLVLGNIAATVHRADDQQKPEPAPQQTRTWETCVPASCTQTVVAFVSYRDCRAYAAYRGQGWRMCVLSDKPPTMTWETCVPNRCTQTVIPFLDIEDCKAYADDHAGNKKCTRPGGA